MYFFFLFLNDSICGGYSLEVPGSLYRKSVPLTADPGVTSLNLVLFMK